jgi:hypothetical protein
MTSFGESDIEIIYSFNDKKRAISMVYVMVCDWFTECHCTVPWTVGSKREQYEASNRTLCDYLHVLLEICIAPGSYIAQSTYLDVKVEYWMMTWSWSFSWDGKQFGYRALDRWPCSRKYFFLRTRSSSEVCLWMNERRSLWQKIQHGIGKVMPPWLTIQHRNWNE